MRSSCSTVFQPVGGILVRCYVHALGLKACSIRSIWYRSLVLQFWREHLVHIHNTARILPAKHIDLVVNNTR